jgi:4-diphosphocytidyl-2-C-methyl-D-erythritol kinase
MSRGRAPLRLRAFAKVNLALAVGPTRPDGFHEVATVMQAVSLHDVLEFRPRARGFILAVDGPEARGVPRDGTNLVLRAARLLAAELGEPRGASIRLTKNVPHGAGLGGGSSDAAATLRGLAILWERRVSRARLQGLAARLGSDVPFFLGPGTALATGRGEILRPLPHPTPALRLVLVAPRVAVSTAWAYAHYDIQKSRLTHWKQVVNLLQLRGVLAARREVKHRLFNDLEGVVLPRVAAVRKARQALVKAGAQGVLMSGSGSAVFGLVPDVRIPPRVIAARLSRSFSRVYVARSVRAGSRVCR